jgi:hypothetical protein
MTFAPEIHLKMAAGINIKKPRISKTLLADSQNTRPTAFGHDAGARASDLLVQSQSFTKRSRYSFYLEIPQRAHDRLIGQRGNLTLHLRQTG